MTLDPESASKIGTGLAFLGGSPLLVKLLGPTAEYVGEGLKEWAQRRVSNVRVIFEIAVRKLGSRMDEQGAVPPKVLRGVLTDGSFCDDRVSQEYLGGVLASSRTGIQRDDRGAYFLDLINRLSSYQIRAHYLLYATFKSLWNGTQLNLQTGEARSALGTYMPLAEFETAMDFRGEELNNINGLLGHIFVGLENENLIDPTIQLGPEGHIRKTFPAAPEPGIIFNPSALGVEFFLSANGRADLDINQFLDPVVTIENITGVRIPGGVLRLKKDT